MSDFYRWPHRALMRVRQTVGWASTIDAKSLLALRIDNNDPSMRLMPKPMRPGWYMLEVMASQLTLGSNLTLVQGPSTHSLALMQPGPNKRVVHLTSKDTLRLHLDSPWELINGSSLTLSRISNRFAQSRQIQKIKNNANCAAPGFRAHEAVIKEIVVNPITKVPNGNFDRGFNSSVKISNCYSAFIERRTKPCSYRSWLDRQIQRPHTACHQTDLLAPKSDLFSTVQLQHGSTSPPQSTDQPVLLFDQEVNWQPYAVEMIEKTLRSDSKVKLFYFDHDHCDAQDAPVAPIFKPPWNPTLLRSGNYIGAVIVLRPAAYNQVATELMRSGNTLQQTTVFQWLLALRLSLAPEHVHRVPFILYRQKIDTQWLENNTGRQPLIGVHRQSSDQLALNEHLQSIGTSAKVIAHDTLPAFDIHYPPLTDAPSVDIIIPTRDRIDLLEQCLTSLLSLTRYPNFCITVVDNDSQEKASLNFFAHMVSKYPSQVKVLSWPHTFNYSTINNYAAKQSDKDVLVLLNNDTEVQHSDWLMNMISELEQPGTGCVGAKLLYPSGRIQHAGVMTSKSAIAGHAHRFFNATDFGYLGRLQLTHNVAAVTAACLAIRRSLFMSIDGLDQDHLTVAFNDVDLCLKVRAQGLGVVWTPKASLIHHESVSRGLDHSTQKAQRFADEISTMRERWGDFLDEDCAWHPIFELPNDDWDIAPWCQLY